MFSKIATMRSTSIYCNSITWLKEELDTADAVVIGAGSGLSISAGFTYTGERFCQYFGDFIEKYGFHDMYSGGSILLTVWKNTGHIGADIFTSTAIAMHQSRFTMTS